MSHGILVGDRTHGQGLSVERDRRGTGIQRRHRLVGGEVLDRPLTDQKDGVDQREQQQIERDAPQIDPGIADGAGRMSGEAAHQGHGDRDAGGGGEEILYRKTHWVR